MFKKTSKPAKDGEHQDLLEISASNDSLSDNTNNTKESEGFLSGMFKKSPKPSDARASSQEDLSADGELSGSKDDLSNNKESGGMLSGMFKKSPFKAKTQSQEDLSAASEHSGSSDNLSENHTMDDLFMVDDHFANNKDLTEKSKEKSSNTDEEMPDGDGDTQPSHKQSKLAGGVTKMNPFRAANKSIVAKAMSKLNPFHSAHKDADTAMENEKQLEEKPKLVKSNLIQPERKERSETPRVPPRSAKEEVKGMSAYNKVKQRRHEEKSQSGHEGSKDDESVESKDGDENHAENKTTKVKKHKKLNPFMPQAVSKAASDDEGPKDEESSSREERKDEEGKEKTEEAKVKKPRRHNPFMPRVKAKVVQKHEGNDGGAAAENEGGNRSLFDQLEDYRINPSQPENSQDMEDLMDWWNTVESWEDTPQVDDMTEKEEVKAFAVTAEKVQKGIRVFNKLFSERAESLWQHVIDLIGIADALDKFNKNTKIAQITGGSTSAIGGVATIAGLALAPVTMGTSLIVTAVGLAVATAGGLTSAGAGISNQVNNSMDRKKVEKIVEDYQEKMIDLNKSLKFIKQGIENLRRFDLIKMKKHAYNRDFPALTSSFYEDGAMAGKAILINANEIMRVVQVANVAGSTAARAVQIASMATGVLTGLFVGMDIYFVAKDSKELKKGAKSEFAAKIREVATQLHEGLVELNGIREELQSTAPARNTGGDTKALNCDSKEEDDKSDSSEDEIDRIKKAIQKDIENRDYGS